MKLVFIYGPPATGKLTVAKELAKITEYKIFHNHLTADLVASIFPFGTKEYSDLTADIRLKAIEAAAQKRVKGVIFTLVYKVETYGGKTDDQFIKKLIRKVKKYNGSVYFVKLSCERKELHIRVKHPSRQALGKVNNVKTLKSLLEKYSVNDIIPFVESQVIDNTKLSPKKVAQMIKNYHSL